jgi:hypothetical protein
LIITGWPMRMLLLVLALASGCVRLGAGGSDARPDRAAADAPLERAGEAARERAVLEAQVDAATGDTARRDVAALDAKRTDQAKLDLAKADAPKADLKVDQKKPDPPKLDLPKPDLPKPDLPTPTFDVLPTSCTPIANLKTVYYFCGSAFGWYAAEKTCVYLKRHLVTVDDALENEWLRTTATALWPTADYLWLGASDLAQEGSWSWSSGITFSFAQWGSGEPNNSNSNEHCAELRLTNFSGLKPGDWNDSVCTDLKHFVCE